MVMKKFPEAAILAALAVAIFTASPEAIAQRDTLGVAPVQPVPALAAAVAGEGKSNQMDQVLQSLDEQLVDRMHATRKFQIVARGDLKVLLTEQALASSGNIDAADRNAAQQFKLAGAKYVLAAKLDGFKDYSSSSIIGETDQRATIRILSVSAVAKIYDPTSGKLYESANFQVRKEDKKLSLRRGNENAALSDELLVGVARELAERIANRVTDVVFPAKVVSKIDRQLAINRGDGTGITIGQLWNAYAVGNELIDPDTGESLGREEVKVGEVRIVSVQPKTSTAEIVGEDRGITIGAILRLPQ